MKGKPAEEKRNPGHAARWTRFDIPPLRCHRPRSLLSPSMCSGHRATSHRGKAAFKCGALGERLSSTMRRSRWSSRVAKVNRSTEGFHTWTPDEIARFRAFWPLGSTPRLAMEVMINTGARRSDAHRIGPRSEYTGAMVCGGRASQHTRGVSSISHSDRCTVDARAYRGAGKDAARRGSYILFELNRPYTKESFRSTFKRWCVKAHLLECSSHGLRKAAAVLYAESGATAPELMALLGWSNMKTAQIYIAQADKRRMAANAQERLAAHTK